MEAPHEYIFKDLNRAGEASGTRVEYLALLFGTCEFLWYLASLFL